MIFFSFILHPIKYIAAPVVITDVMHTVMKRITLWLIKQYIVRGNTIETMLTIITLKYTSFKKSIMFNLIDLRKKISLDAKQSCETIIPTKSVLSGIHPFLSIMYDIGTFISIIPPTVI